MSEQSDVEENCGNFQSEYQNLYKNTGRNAEISHEERRQVFLKHQKEKRATNFDETRDLRQLFTIDDAEEEMDCDGSVTDTPKKQRLPFQWRMMGAELLTEIPVDFTENWIVKPCPEGTRYLLVARKGYTTCYLRNGRSYFKFSSNLPGGNKESPHKFTVLDCIFNKDVNTYFIFDVLAWNSVSFLNAEALYRFCWLKTKFDENPDLYRIKSTKNIDFYLMNPLPGDLSLLQDMFFRPFTVNDVNLPYEGILFYHKEGFYKFGHTPLVGWLKSFMITEILHIDVDLFHLKNKPPDYVSISQYTKRKSKRLKKSKGVEMEIEHTPTN